MTAKTESIYVIRIVLKNSKPPIWRKLAVPSGVTLGQLHELIQLSMGWDDEHLHQFMVRDKKPRPTREERNQYLLSRFQQGGNLGLEGLGPMRGERYFGPTTDPMGNPMDLDGEDEDGVTLAEVCPKAKCKLTYEYDFGDGWEHEITVQKIADPEPGKEYPVCLGGKMACPPEDCGGLWGYYAKLDILADPEDESREEVLEWMGDDFDPEAFDLEAVNGRLARWRKRK